MPDGVIAAVETMAENKGQPLIRHGAPLFEWSPGVTIEDENPELMLEIEQQDKNKHDKETRDVSDGEEDGNAVTNHEIDGTNDGFLNVNGIQNELEDEDANENKTENKNEHKGKDKDKEESCVEHIQQPAPDIKEDIRSKNGSGSDGTSGPTDTPTIDSRSRYSLRPNRARNYDNRLDHLMDNPRTSGQSYDIQ
jgi:hypothetical protein